ncbi:MULTISPECIES: acylphosphatase [unclassified Wenzhouxiangella]|uniref:acylphosphatase n=1 Tax=unclassified Wenzhouxiangella TaxID=2613841 RepID=UPI000E32B2D2|nr:MULTISPECIES: acylphosphatase [unclassified Wenzhouxiangella]RFF27104.1 acylphosphatase [Wenzhouxiangella sp. 15181]RFP69210.1 acylphosphatase [Wenzhouxiangella sp. 15190]
MSKSETRKWLISGRVQGVFFRESTRRQAEPLGLSGHAVNLPDGRVEVVATGSPSALDELERWLHDGPSAARVDKIEQAQAPERVSPGFLTG